jgi:hypothetical protein
MTYDRPREVVSVYGVVYAAVSHGPHILSPRGEGTARVDSVPLHFEAVVVAHFLSAEQDLRHRMAEIEANAYGLARDKGMIVHQLTPDEVADWRACSAGMMEDFMSTSGELGRRLMAAYGTLRTEPCCTAGPQGNFTNR